MRKSNEFFIGCIGARISALLQIADNPVSRSAIVMITSVDSSIDMIGITHGYAILERWTGCELLGGSLLVPGDEVGAISSALNLFNGFDEIWCFDNVPKLEKPADVSIVPPIDFNVGAVRTNILDWVRGSGCRLGLGDGIGMNYLTPDESIAIALERAATVQP